VKRIPGLWHGAHLASSKRMRSSGQIEAPWWQAGVFKLGMLALGIAIGTYWSDVFGAYLLTLIIVAAVSLAYTTYVWWKQ